MAWTTSENTCQRLGGPTTKRLPYPHLLTDTCSQRVCCQKKCNTSRMLLTGISTATPPRLGQIKHRLRQRAVPQCPCVPCHGDITAGQPSCLRNKAKQSHKSCSTWLWCQASLVLRKQLGAATAPQCHMSAGSGRAVISHSILGTSMPSLGVLLRH